MKQQIVVSGFGGQGVLFLTKILGQTAVDMGRSILISETHGMAQRGGNVISHLKVGPPPNSDSHAFTSPLIRPGHANILFALHPEALDVHGHYLGKDGSSFVDCPTPRSPGEIDATTLAQQWNRGVGANLVLLGYALASGLLYCTASTVMATMKAMDPARFSVNRRLIEAGMDWNEAFAAGSRKG